MNTDQTSRTRLSLRAGGVLAIAAGVLMAAPASTAHAAETDAAGVSDHELVEFHEQMKARRNAAARMATDLLGRALGRSAERASEARSKVELWVTWGYGFDGLQMLDPSVFEGERDDDDSEPAPPTRRFEYSSDTEDPLAGLL